MFVRNLLHPSDFVALAPQGMPTTLQYDDRGILEKVYWGYTRDDRVDITDCILSAAKITDEVRPFPFKISLKGGTTWITGVIYTDTTQFTNSVGYLPNCIKDEFISLFSDNPGNFHFFAACIDSLCTQFKGAVNIRRWLDMAGFDILPGFIAPANITKESITHSIEHCGYNFNQSPVVSYIIFRGSDILYEHTGLFKYVVSSVSRFNDSNGHIKAKLNIKNNNPIFIDYSELVKFDIHTNTMLVTDTHKNVLFAYPTDNKKRDKISTTITCEYCGCSFKCPEEGLVKCINDRCMSLNYSKVIRILSCFKLPEIPYNEYIKLVSNKEILDPVDILNTNIYSDMNLSATISDIFAAIVPITVVANKQLFTVITNQCNNNINTILFYLHNPEKIMSNLDINSTELVNLIQWLTNESNANDIINLLEHDKVSVQGKDIKFNGIPLFRNKTIMITGKFVHGDQGDIISILQSYSANVVTKLDDKTQCIVVGDIPEDVNSSAIRKCRQHNIPVFTESQFFDKFKIDEDLAENLLY